jgi:hypothetical protein
MHFDAKFQLHIFSMNELLTDVIDRTQSEIIEMQARENQLQEEQEAASQQISQLREEIQLKYHHQSKIELEIVEVCARQRELKSKLVKLLTMANVVGNLRELLDRIKNDSTLIELFHTSVGQNERHLKPSSGFDLDKIRSSLPNTDAIYQVLSNTYRDTYQACQGYQVENMDVVWCTLAFIAFGRSLYRKFTRNYGFDEQSYANEKLLINTAWDVRCQYLNSFAKTA